MNDLLYKIATLLSFLLIGISSLMQNNTEKLAMRATLSNSIIIILLCIVFCIFIIIIISFYKRCQNKIIFQFQFSKNKKILNVINNHNYDVCIYIKALTESFVAKSTINKNDIKTNKNSFIIPSKMNDNIDININENDRTLLIFYHFVLPLPNDYCKGNIKLEVLYL